MISGDEFMRRVFVGMAWGWAACFFGMCAWLFVVMIMTIAGMF